MRRALIYIIHSHQNLKELNYGRCRICGINIRTYVKLDVRFRKIGQGKQFISDVGD
jgi:hypothetical protein